MGRLGARVVAPLAIAVLLFQTGYVPPSARAAEPDPSAGAINPVASPEPSPGASPSATVPVTEQSGSGVLPAKPPLLASDPVTGLKPGAVEIATARTEYSQTFANSDGTFTTQMFMEPAFYKVDGEPVLQPISVGFAPSKTAGMDFASTHAPVTVAIGDAAGTSQFLATTYNGRTIGFRLPDDVANVSMPVAPKVDGAVADYAGILPGVDLRVIANAHGAKSFFVWGAAPADPTFRYVVEAPGLTLKPEDDGSVALVDDAGSTVARIPRPYAVDSTDDPLLGGGQFTDKVSLGLGADGRTVTVSVDPDWLSKATFPVYVDPSTGWVYNAGSDSYGDAHIASNYPTLNFDDYQRPDSPYYHELWNGTDPSGLSGESYDFLRWDMSARYGDAIDAATLALFPYHQYYNSPTAETTYVRRVGAAWTENGITWNNKPNYASSPVPSAGCVEGSLCQWNVATIVQGSVDGQYTNYGYQVDTIGKGGTYWKRFISSEQGGTNRPKLSVDYHLPVTALYPVGGGPSPDTTLSWSSDGPWATQIAYSVDVATDAAFTSIVASSGTVSSSAQEWAIPTALTPGTTYYWRVKIQDTYAYWSHYSATESFVYDLANLGLQQQFKTEDFGLGGGDQASVNVATGNLVLSHPIVSLPIRGSSVALGLTYNSQDPATLDMGPGWRLNVERRLTINANGTVTFIDADGARYTFTNPQTVGTVTSYTRPAALFATLTKDTSQGMEFTLRYRDLSRDTFDIAGSEGLLIRSEDRHANGTTVAYVSGTNRITTITDTAGSRTINFAYDGSNRVSSITDWAYLDGSGVVQTSATGSHRAARFFYDASGNLAGWADPLNAAGSCPTGGSHLTCLTYSSTILSIAKTQTVEGTGASSLTTSTRSVTTQIGLVGDEVVSVKDAEQVAASGPAATFSRDLNQMIVLRPGTPTSTTTYGYLASTDPYARVQSTWRLLGATNIEHRTVYDSTYPTLAASETDNYGALLSTPARTVSTTYVASSLGLVARTVEPLTSSPATNRWTDFTYNANNDLVQKVVSQDGSSSLTTTTRYCYDAGCTLTATGLDQLGEIDHYVSAGAQNADTNVTTNWTYDAYGQRLTETRHNRDAAGATRDDRVTSYAYDSLGDQTSQIVNYANGTVTSPGDDVTPNTTTGARTDLTTTFAYDTAGNQVSVIDPRRAIESAKGTTLTADDFISRTTFDALGQALVQTLPTTPTSLGGSSCSPDPGCRQTSSAYDEFGGVRQSTSYAPSSGSPLQTGTEFDRDGRSTRTFEDTDGSGALAPAVTGKTVYDVAGRTVDAYDRIQAGSATAGTTHTVYDGLGRTTDVTTAYGSSPDASSVNHTVFDGLDRATQSVVGYGSPAPQSTTTAYDLGGRAITTNDGFTCQTSVFDYRDAVTSVTDGLDGSCASVSGQTRTITSSLDGLGRTYRQEITSGPGTGDRTQDDTFDATGSRLTSATKTSGVTSTTTFTANLLDQVLAEARPDGSVTKTTYDPVANAVDRCVWSSTPTDPCLPAGSTFNNPQPTQVISTGYDARNQRVTLATGTGSAVTSTTTYDPAKGYQVSAVYLPTASGKEYQTLYTYDARQRLATVTNQLCVISSGHACSSTTAAGSDTYAYDDNDNRTRVNESNGATSLDRYYCYDAANRLVSRRTGSDCLSAPTDETNTYDATGNRTQAVTGGVTTNFAYNANGQLCKVGATSCTSPNVTYDSDGRTATWNGWAYLYDAEARMTSACQSSSCSGSGFNRLDFSYDGEGHRTKIVETTAAGVVTTTTFAYQGDAVAAEAVSTGLTRTFVTDDAGRIIRVTISGDPDPDDNATFLVAWSGHGDALGLWRQNGDGSLTLANSYAYSTWGVPTTTVASPFSDLGFRYLYVGAGDVQSDNAFGAGLLYMHARHYSPVLGRFLQPDPARAEANLYGYVGGNPASRIDPCGQSPIAFGNCGVTLLQARLVSGRIRVTVTAVSWFGPIVKGSGTIVWNNMFTGGSGLITFEEFDLIPPFEWAQSFGLRGMGLYRFRLTVLWTWPIGLAPWGICGLPPGQVPQTFVWVRTGPG